MKIKVGFIRLGNMGLPNCETKNPVSRNTCLNPVNSDRKAKSSPQQSPKDCQFVYHTPGLRGRDLVSRNEAQEVYYSKNQIFGIMG